MELSRRGLLRLGGVGAVCSLAGCSRVGGPSEYVPVVVENSNEAVHAISLSVISPPDETGGYTSYVSEVVQLGPGERETFDEALALTDFQPELLAMAMTDDETTETATFSLDVDLRELVFRITDGGQIRITTTTAG